jgi:hypothetical protein
MKLKASSLFLGICLAVLASAVSPAYARSTPGFNTFWVQQGSASEYGKNNPLDCLTEYWGEVVNYCGLPG